MQFLPEPTKDAEEMTSPNSIPAESRDSVVLSLLFPVALLGIVPHNMIQDPLLCSGKALVTPKGNWKRKKKKNKEDD